DVNLVERRETCKMEAGILVRGPRSIRAIRPELPPVSAKPAIVPEELGHPEFGRLVGRRQVNDLAFLRVCQGETFPPQADLGRMYRYGAGPAADDEDVDHVSPGMGKVLVEIAGNLADDDIFFRQRWTGVPLPFTDDHGLILPGEPGARGLGLTGQLSAVGPLPPH